MANNLKVIIQPGQKLIFTPNPAKRKVIVKKENCNDLHDELKKWKDKYSELLKNSRSKKKQKTKAKESSYEEKSKSIFWENKYKNLRKEIDELVEEYSNQNPTEKLKESPFLLPDNTRKKPIPKKENDNLKNEKSVIPINDFYDTGELGLESVLKIMECYNRIKTFTRKDIVLNKITKDDLYNAALDKGFVPDGKKEKINYLRILLDIYEGFCFITAQQIVTNKTLDTGIKFNNILMLYNNMPSNNVRTTESVSLQQYSTPLPLSFLISQYLYDNHGYNLDVNIFEPTAGTGSLLLRSSYYPDNRNIIVNELDSLRYNILRAIKTKWKSWINNKPNEIITLNSDIFDIYSKNSFGEYGDLYNSDFIFMNPPFGSYKNKSLTQYVNIEKSKYAIPKLEQGIATYCLKFLKQNGIMAIILGGHTLKKNKYQGYEIANRNDIPFLKYIYSNYQLLKHIEINGDLYVKGGTKFDIRLIILKNTKPDKPKKVPMEYGNGIDKANSWEDLYKLLIESPEKSASSHQPEQTNNKDKDLEILKRITPEIQHDTLFDTMVYRRDLNRLIKIIGNIPKSYEEVENVKTGDLICYLHIFASPAIDLYVTNFVNYDNENLDEIELRLIGSIPSDGTFEFGYYTLEQLEYLYKDSFKKTLIELDLFFSPTKLKHIKDARNDYYNEEEDEYEKEPIDESDDDTIRADHRGLEDEQGEIGTHNGRVAHDLPSSGGQFDTQRRVHESDSDEDSGMESDGRGSNDFISEGAGKGHGRVSQEPQFGEREFQSSECDSPNNEGSIDEDKLKSVEKILEILESKGFEL